MPDVRLILIRYVWVIITPDLMPSLHPGIGSIISYWFILDNAMPTAAEFMARNLGGALILWVLVYEILSISWLFLGNRV